MKKLLLTIALFAFAMAGFAQTPSNGDYRSAVATGNWNTPATWQIRSAGAWATATVAPNSANNVYIQDGHTINIATANVDCKDLDINITGVVNIGTNILNVSGKIRAYSGVAEISASDGVYTGTSSTSLSSSMLNTTSPGVLKFVGISRNIYETGEWAGTQTSNDVEFALSPGAIGILIDDMKFNDWTFSSGVISATSSARLVVGNNITIKNGARLISDRNGVANTVLGAGATAKSNIFTINNGGVLELTGTAPAIDVTTFVNNGTVEYSKSGTQTLLQPGSDPTSTTALNSYQILVLSSSSTKTPFAPISVKEMIKFTGTATLGATASLPITLKNGSLINRETTSGTQLPSAANSVMYGETATDIINVTIGATNNVSNELVSAPSPGKFGTLTVNSGVTYTFLGSRTFMDLVNNGIVNLNPSTLMTITINGDVSGSGTISSIARASISIGGTTGGSAGTLAFTNSSQNINNLIINRSGTNPSVTIGNSVTVNGNISLTNGIINIPPSVNLTTLSSTLHNGGSSTSYLNTQNAGANVGKVIVPLTSVSKTIHVGSGSNYLPITLNPVNASDFAINVFQGATTNAQPNGTPLTAVQKVDVVDANYNIVRTSGTGNCDVTLGWDANLEGTSFTAFPDSQVGVAQYTGGAYGTFVGPGDNTANTISTTVASFDPMLIGKVGTLPVKLISFTAKANNQTAVLSWTTTSEVNVSHYLVQRSADGKTFETLTSIPAKNTAGVFNYGFVDNAPAFGANYYQLASVDTDGTTSPSGLQSVNFGAVASVTVYPNPTKGAVNIAGLVKGDVVKVTDLLGRAINTQDYSGEGTMSLSLDAANSGIYLITVSNNGTLTSTQRLIKN